MRIISGKYKGRVLDGFDIKGTRPTMERVKESLFAQIQMFIPNSHVLDLFSGSGNLGLEALSEGAHSAVLVDSNPKAVSIIKKNIEKLGCDSVKVLGMDYVKAIHSLEEKFDIIFLDPPYQTNYIEKSIEEITKKDLVKKGGIIVCESDSIDKIVYPEVYSEIKNKTYGDKTIVIIQKI